MQKIIKVKDILDEKYDLNLELISGQKGLYNEILIPKLQKKGLAFAGLTEVLEDGRILIIGNSESKFLEKFNERELDNIINTLFDKKLPAIIYTNNNKIALPFINYCNMYNVPLFRTNLKTSEVIPKLTKILEDYLTPTITYHGVLLDIHGVGVLLEGDSGVGKSEIALDMILKGHRFVADDVINIKFIPPNLIVGSSPEPLKAHLEIRGLGIIDVEELFGIASLREEKRIDIVIKLTKSLDEVDRIMMNQEFKELLKVKIPFFKLPITNGRNISTLVEVTARYYMLKKHHKMNYDPTEKFLNKLYKNDNRTNTGN